MLTNNRKLIYRQKRKIQSIQLHIKNYRDNPHIQLSDNDIVDHLYHLEVIADVTEDSKVAKKANSLRKLILRIKRYRILEAQKKFLSDICLLLIQTTF